MQEVTSDQVTEPTPISGWKTPAKDVKPTTLPSGNSARLRRVSLQTFLKTGRVPNVLMKPMKRAIEKKQEMTPDELKELMSDPEAIGEMFKLVDMIAVDAFIEPKLTPLPDDESEGRREDLLYVDEIDLDDKMFIFQWMVGGTSDLEQFRNEQSKQLAAVSSSENVGGTPEPVGKHSR